MKWAPEAGGNSPDYADKAISAVEQDVKTDPDKYAKKNLDDLVKKANDALPKDLDEADRMAASMSIAVNMDRLAKALSDAKLRTQEKLKKKE